jgi:sugar fermentation stimulation protein A
MKRSEPRRVSKPKAALAASEEHGKDPSSADTKPAGPNEPTISLESCLYWPPLVRGTLIARVNRFVADVRLDTGETIAAHCPNSGSMAGCCEPGRPVYLSRSDNPRRRLAFTWELIEMPDSLVGVNTLVPNRLVKRSIETGVVPELAGYAHIRPEARVGNSRLDLLLTGDGSPPCYVEVKNCTLVIERGAYFPDAVTSRGTKHLHELMLIAAEGMRAVMFFLTQRSDAEWFHPADHVDPVYGATLREAVSNGVELLCYDCRMDTTSIALRRKLPIRL